MEVPTYWRKRENRPLRERRPGSGRDPTGRRAGPAHRNQRSGRGAQVRAAGHGAGRRRAGQRVPAAGPGGAAGEDPLLRRELRQPQGGEPGRGAAHRAVLLLQAAVGAHRPGRRDRQAGPGDPARLRGGTGPDHREARQAPVGGRSPVGRLRLHDPQRRERAGRAVHRQPDHPGEGRGHVLPARAGRGDRGRTARPPGADRVDRGQRRAPRRCCSRSPACWPT
jgi:hypothetical protein